MATPQKTRDVVIGSGVLPAHVAPTLGVYDGMALFNNTGSLPTPVTSITGVFSKTASEAVHVAVRDINGDGLPEIIVGTGAGPLQEEDVFTTGLTLIETFSATQLGLPAKYTAGINVA